MKTRKENKKSLKRKLNKIRITTIKVITAVAVALFLMTMCAEDMGKYGWLILAISGGWLTLVAWANDCFI